MRQREAFSEALAAMFFNTLLQRLPAWRRHFAECDAERLVQIEDPYRTLPPFVISIARGDDTIVVSPFCPFGLDYIFTEGPGLVAGVIALAATIEDFARGRTIAHVRRLKVLWWETGHRVDFAPCADAARLEAAGACIIRWPRSD